MEGSILDSFLKIGFNFAYLHGSGKIFDFMERLHVSVTGFAKMTAPSFKNLPERLSTPAHSFSTYADFSKKLTFLIALIPTRSCAYQGVRNVSFSESFG